MRTSQTNRGLLRMGVGTFAALLLGMLPNLGHAQTYYFTQGAATTATDVNTYSTDAAGISQFHLGNTTGDFTDATALIPEENAAVLIHDYIDAGWVSSGTGTFNLDQSFPTFSPDSKALWMNPNGATQTADQPEEFPAPLNVSAWSDGTWEASVSFTINDVSLYSGFFIEGQHYADDSVTMTINGHAIAVPSVNVGWENNPPAVTQVAIDSAFLNSGTNTITFTITNFNPETSNDEGPSGLMGYGRVGASVVPEPSTVLLVGVAGFVVLFGRRRAARA